MDSDGNIRYPRGRVLVNTLFFVVGISFTFFLLGFGFTALGSFFRSNQTWFARISGIIMILFGLYQFGVFSLGRPGAGAPAALPAGPVGAEPAGGPGAWLYLQLCVDALAGPRWAAFC